MDDNKQLIYELLGLNTFKKSGKQKIVLLKKFA